MLTPDEKESIFRKLAEIDDKLSNLLKIVSVSPGIRSLPIDDHVVLVRLANGQRLYVDSRDITVGEPLMTRGIYEPQNTALIRSLVRPGDTCIDVGANFGYFSVLLGGIVGPKAKVHSFEANPHLRPLLRRSVKANALRNVVKVYDAALGAAQGTAMLSFKMGDFVGGSLHTSKGRLAAGDLEQVGVRVETLDSFAIDVPARLFMKMDCEGSEYDVLRGGIDLLKRCPNFTMMLGVNQSYFGSRISKGDYFDFLYSLGLSFYFPQAAGLRAASRDELMSKPGLFEIVASNTSLLAQQD